MYSVKYKAGDTNSCTQFYKFKANLKKKKSIFKAFDIFFLLGCSGRVSSILVEKTKCSLSPSVGISKYKKILKIFIAAVKYFSLDNK